MLKFCRSSNRLSAHQSAVLESIKWHLSQQISEQQLISRVLVDPILDEDESWEDYLATLDDPLFYSADTEFGEVVGISSSGIDSLFTLDGVPSPFDSIALPDPISHPLSWVLCPPNSALSNIRDEHVSKDTHRLRVIEGFSSGQRMQLLDNNIPVCGLEIKDGSVETIFTDPGYRNKGCATELVRYARMLHPNLSRPSNLTHDGAKFFGSRSVDQVFLAHPSERTALSPGF